MGSFVSFFLQSLAVFFVLFLFDRNKSGLIPKIVQAGVLSFVLSGIGFVGGMFGIIGIVLGWVAALAIIKNLLKYEIGEALLFLFCLGIINQIISLVVGT
jgi:hypothetical protein